MITGYNSPIIGHYEGPPTRHYPYTSPLLHSPPLQDGTVTYIYTYYLLIHTYTHQIQAISEVISIGYIYNISIYLLDP